MTKTDSFQWFLRAKWDQTYVHWKVSLVRAFCLLLNSTVKQDRDIYYVVHQDKNNELWITWRQHVLRVNQVTPLIQKSYFHRKATRKAYYNSLCCVMNEEPTCYNETLPRLLVYTEWTLLKLIPQLTKRVLANLTQLARLQIWLFNPILGSEKVSMIMLFHFQQAMHVSYAS